jgi:glutamate/tyrosine decarboxylase-like PLP-dependent enzyme
MTMQQIGLKGYRQLISRDIDLARKLQAKIQARSDFELVASGALSVTCFLYRPEGREDVEAVNRKLLPVVQAEGQVFLTGTELEGRFALRACIVNFRTSEADLDFLLDVIAEAGSRV